jgi:hypothetical protein
MPPKGTGDEMDLGENRRHSTDQSRGQRRRSGLEGMRINKDQGLGTPNSWNTEDVISTPHAVETSKDSNDRSSFNNRSSCFKELKHCTQMDEYSQSEDNIAETPIRGHLNKNSAATVWDDTSIKTEQPTSLNGWKDHCSIDTDIDLERLAGKLWQPTCMEIHPEQSDFSVDEVLKSSSTPYVETHHSLQ